MRHVLTGRAALAGDQYELALTLNDLTTHKPRWSETFRGGTNELIELERRALAKVLIHLGAELSGDAAREVSQLLTNNLEALDWLRKARNSYDRQGAILPALNEAMGLAHNAYKLDPRYLDARSHFMYMLRNEAQERYTPAAWGQIKDYADGILSLDDTHALALETRAGVSLILDQNWLDFEGFRDRTLAAHPDHLRPIYRALYLRIGGCWEEAWEEQQRAEDPLPELPDYRWLMASARWAHGDYGGAIHWARHWLQTNPDFYDFHVVLAQSLVADGRCEEGIAAILNAQKIHRSQRQELTALLACAHARLGQTAKAREILEQLCGPQENRYAQPYLVARIHAALEDKEAALKWLEQAAEDRSEFLFVPDWGGLRTDPAWKPLTNDARYWQLCDRLRLGPADWPRKNVVP